MTIQTLSSSSANQWIDSQTAIQNYLITTADINNTTSNFYANKLYNHINTDVVSSNAKVVKNPYSSLETYTLAELIYNNINYDSSKLPSDVGKFKPKFDSTSITIDTSGAEPGLIIEDNLGSKLFEVTALGGTTIKGNTTIQGDTSIEGETTLDKTLTIKQSGSVSAYLSLKNLSDTETFSIKPNNANSFAKIETNGPLLFTGSGSNIKIQTSGAETKFEVDKDGNTTINGTLDVSGATTFSGSATFESGVTINSTNLIIPVNTYVVNNISPNEPSARIATQGDIQTATLGLTMKEPVKVLFDFSGKTTDVIYGTTSSNDNNVSAFRQTQINDQTIFDSFGDYRYRTVTDPSSGNIVTYDLYSHLNDENLIDRSYNLVNSGTFILGIRNTFVINALDNTTVTDDSDLISYLPAGTRILLHTPDEWFSGIWIVTHVSDSNPTDDIEKSRTWLVRASDYDDIGIDTTESQNSYTFVQDGHSQGGYIINCLLINEGMVLSTLAAGQTPDNVAMSYSYYNLKANKYKINQFSGFGEINITSTQTSGKQSVTVSKDTTSGKANYVIGLDLDSTNLNNGDNGDNANIVVLKDILKSYDQTFKTLFANLEINNFTYYGIYTDTLASRESNTQSI